MTSPQRLPASLTPLDTALDALLKGVEPAAPVELPLNEAVRCIAAEMPLLEAHPSRDIAAVDGYAFRDLFAVLALTALAGAGAGAAATAIALATATTLTALGGCRRRFGRLDRRSGRGRWRDRG